MQLRLFTADEVLGIGIYDRFHLDELVKANKYPSRTRKPDVT